MSIIKVRNPVAEPVARKVEPAPRLGDLDGRRIGLYWNMKGGGDVALARIREVLGERYPGASFAEYQGSVGGLMRHCTAADADRIAKEVDAVIGTTSD